jgi:hypothetical protein
MPAGGKLVHGHKRRGATSLEYKTWLGMKRRCNDVRFKDYAKYGARGIKVAQVWDESFEAFLSDMGPRPSPKHQIDRIDSSRGYEPGNCRWVTPFEQGSEHRNNLVPVTVKGLSFPSLNAAARHFGIGNTTVNYRLHSGVPLDRVFDSG